MDTTWILVANASLATLYSFESSPSPQAKPKLTVVDNFSHPESRMKDTDIASDRAGEYINTAGGHGNFTEQSDPHQYEATVFARELSKKLEQGRTQNQYRKLILVAAPHFMGLLRECIAEKPFGNIKIEEIQKDYTKAKPHELLSLLNLQGSPGFPH
ncbi:MAG: host attachment protein [Proteobacteria bacterium]|nr:host attachment protein [Pseudomonadota bacterium]